MIKKLFSFLTGTYRITVDSESKTEAADLLYKNSISCLKSGVDKNQNWVVTLNARDFKAAASLWESCAVVYKASELQGFPRLTRFLLGRPGFIAGALIFSLALFYSPRIIWDEQVSGNSNLTEEQVIAVLDEFGLGIGSYLPSINFDRLHADILASSEDISWISVNMRGSVAKVEIREARHGPTSSHPEGVYANLISAEDAQIYSVEVTSGKSAVKKGAVVKKGDLLITGVVPVRPDKVRYEYASGEALAYVTRSISVEIPFECEEKVYTGKSKTENSIKIFKKLINLSLKGGIEYTIYDKIESSNQLSLWGLVRMPVWINKTRFDEYTYVTSSRSPDEAVSLAFSELRESMDEALADCELIRAKYTTDITDYAFVVRVDMVCLTNIATVSEFTVEGATDKTTQ